MDPHVLEALNRQKLRKKAKKEPEDKSYLRVTHKMLQKREEYLENKPKGKFQTWLDDTFFLRYNRFFGKDFRYHCKRMYPLPAAATCKNTTAMFKENLQKLINEYEVKAKNSENLEYDGNHFYLTKPLIMSLKYPMIWGTILKLISQCISITLPFFIAVFIKLIKSEGTFDYLKAIRTCLMVLVLSIFAGICQEHSNKYVSKIKSTGG
jgi:hypothetical protein